jgi:hypothetical protein
MAQSGPGRHDPLFVRFRSRADSGLTLSSKIDVSAL